MNLSKTLELARNRMNETELKIMNVFEKKGLMPIIKKANGKYGCCGSTMADQDNFKLAVELWLKYLKTFSNVDKPTLNEMTNETNLLLKV